MASGSTQIASSSSMPRWKYDVFLSFCGKDTRQSFTDHLYAALKQKGINVFRDDEKLERGKPISKELLKTIEESQYAVVVISKKFAFSKWCLMELSKILECSRDARLTVLPVFYRVDPSKVRKLEGTFTEAFAEHKKAPQVDKKQRKLWRAALKEVGGLGGWHIHDRSESSIIEEICKTISGGLKCNLPDIFRDLVGMESQVKEVMSLLCIGGDDVRFIQICGMGGIGKTTLAKVVFESVSSQFEACCFIEDVKKETGNLNRLQQQLIYEILKEKDIQICSTHVGMKLIMSRARSIKVMIVLDDVDEEVQLKVLAGSHDWFGKGSRILLTGRDSHVFKRYVDETYEMNELNDSDALKLFSQKAFKKNYPEDDYVGLSMDIVNCAGGLPLALEIFGSHLFGRALDAWESARDFLKANSHEKISDKLQVSYDGLGDLQKKLLLDIAFFFNGRKYVQRTIDILESCGYYPNINVEVLRDKSLIKISQHGRFQMHDLIVKMCQQIVRHESLEPGERSRLCCLEDIINILKNNTATKAVEGIFLKLPLPKQEQLGLEAFSKMTKLRVLEICNKTSSILHDEEIFEGLRTLEWHANSSEFMLSNELHVLTWWGYPLKSFPSNFQPSNLVELIMRGSCIERLWDRRKSFEKLKHIDLYHSRNLIEMPDLSGVPNLEELELSYCTSLSKVHPSIGFLKNLIRLNLQDCKSLKRLPNEISLLSLEYLSLSNCSKIKKLPNIVVPSLIYLDLHGCSRLKEFPYIEGNMASLKGLDLSSSAIKSLPSSFKSLSTLEDLDISGCSKFEEIPEWVSSIKCLEELNASGTAIRELPSSIIFLKKLRFLSVGGVESNCISFFLPASVSSLSSLVRLNLRHCNLLDGALPDDLGCLSSLYALDLSGNEFTRIPECIYQLPNLHRLYLSNCNNIQALANPLCPPLRSLRILVLSYCNLLDGAILNDLNYLFSSLEILNLSGNHFTLIPDSISQLSKLFELKLDHCCSLQVFPKLPLALPEFHPKHCLSMETLYNQIDGWTSSEMSLTNDCSFGVVYFGYDGSCHKTLHLHPQSPVWIENNIATIDNVVTWGPTLGSEIPGWFNQRRISSSGMIQTRIDLGLDEDLEDYLWWGYAMFIVYEVLKPDNSQRKRKRKRKRRKVHEHGNSNSRILDGNNPTFLEFVCHLQVNEDGPRVPLAFSVPEVPPVGQNGIWVFINALCFLAIKDNSNGWSYLGASISSRSPNVEVKECGIHLARRRDMSECLQVLSSNSPYGLDSKSLENVFHLKPLKVYGPIHGNEKL